MKRTCLRLGAWRSLHLPSASAPALQLPATLLAGRFCEDSDTLRAPLVLPEQAACACTWPRSVLSLIDNLEFILTSRCAYNSPPAVVELFSFFTVSHGFRVLFAAFSFMPTGGASSLIAYAYFSLSRNVRTRLVMSAA